MDRCFFQGGSFPFAWKSAVKRSLHRATTGQVGSLDRWEFEFFFMNFEGVFGVISNLILS